MPGSFGPDLILPARTDDTPAGNAGICLVHLADPVHMLLYPASPPIPADVAVSGPPDSVYPSLLHPGKRGAEALQIL